MNIFNFKLLVVSVSLLALSSCGPENAQRNFFRMDTVTEITVVVEKKAIAESLFQSVDSLLIDWEQRFSVENSRSEVKVLNNRSDSIMPSGVVLREMVGTALRYGDTLDGGFDITILPVKEQWGLGENGSENAPLPKPDSIISALKKVDYKNVQIKGDSILFKSPDTRIDVGGIAKGFVLREIAQLFDSRAIADYLISSGGDIVAKGKRRDGKSWRVGIQKPRGGGVLGAVEIDSGSIVTSGDYERFRIVDGVRYHHIFNSKTGYSCPVNQSITVWGPDPVEADIMTTGLFCRSATEILEFVNTRSRLECLVVDSSGQIFISDGWKNKAEIF